MPAKRLAYLTMEAIADWTVDVDLCFPYLHELGWQVEAMHLHQSDLQVKLIDM